MLAVWLQIFMTKKKCQKKKHNASVYKQKCFIPLIKQIKIIILKHAKMQICTRKDKNWEPYWWWFRKKWIW